MTEEEYFNQCVAVFKSDMKHEPIEHYVVNAGLYDIIQSIHLKVRIISILKAYLNGTISSKLQINSL